MKVKIYDGQDEGVVDGVTFIYHGNAVEGLSLHAAFEPDQRVGIALRIQAQPGQVFTLATGGSLGCWQAGHQPKGEGWQVVWDLDVRRETECPRCNTVVEA